MNRSFISLLMLFLFSQVPAYCQSNVSSDGPIKQNLLRAGYVAVPMKLTTNGHHWTVDCKSGNHTYRMLVDTGASESLIDSDFGEKIGKVQEGEKVQLRTAAGKIEGRMLDVRGVKIGDFDTRFVASAVQLIAVQGIASASSTTEEKADIFQGVLGHFFSKSKGCRRLLIWHIVHEVSNP